jgi:hypothetical protein
MNKRNSTVHVPAQARELIESFAVALAEVFESEAHDRLLGVLGTLHVNGAKRLNGQKRPNGAPSRKPKQAGKGAKRDPLELDRLRARLLGHVKNHPGQSIEQIGAALHETTKALTLPMRKLINTKDIKTKGVRRATKYFTA